MAKYKMARTTKPTTGWAQFGVYRKFGPLEKEVLKLAYEFKTELIGLYWNFRLDRFGLRNEHFPLLFGWLTQFETIKAKIWECENLIKKENSHQRTRNSKTPHRARLKVLQEELKKQKSQKDGFFEPYKESLGNVHTFLRGVIAADKKWYENPPAYPESFSEFEREYYDCKVKLRQNDRNINVKYQKLGLHSDVRGDVKDSVKQAEKGFKCGRKPQITEVAKLPIQLKNGGCTFQELLVGKNKQLVLTEMPSENKTGKSDWLVYKVQHRATAGIKKYKTFEYLVRIHRAFPVDAKIQRWSLCVDRFGKLKVCPVISRVGGFAKPVGKGSVTYDLNWREHKEGLAVAYILGEHLHEEVMLPNFVVNRFRRCYEIDAEIDESAKSQIKLLGLKDSNKNRSQTIIKYSLENRGEGDAAWWVRWYNKQREKRNRLHAKAARTRKAIFQNVVARTRSLHSELICDAANIKEIVRTKTRKVEDTRDPLAARSRQNAKIAAAGLFRQLINDSGLTRMAVSSQKTSCICPECHYDNGTKTEDNAKKIRKCAQCQAEWDRDYGSCVEMLARAGVVLPNMGFARTTDVLKTYIKKLGVKTKKSDVKNRGARKVEHKVKQFIGL